MAKSKTKTASSRAKPERVAKQAAKPKTPTKKLKPAAKAKANKRPAAKPKATKAKTAPTTSAKAPVTRKAKAAAKPVSAKTKTKPVRKAQAKAPSPPVALAKPKPPQIGRDWSQTLFLPKTDFPMKAGLPEREPELLKRWARLRLYDRLREEAVGREKFILHDGPPYANGHLHIGHALNKILKDVINRSQSMMGKDANYVPGWDCHGLPIEWKIEEENYRAKGKTKPDLTDPAAMIAFRRECRAYAEYWLDVQREEFKRLGVEGDWEHLYTTMSFNAEATIAAELMRFAMNGTLYRGSKPVMWSVVEKTALAEAEVQYQEIASPAIYVRFPIEHTPFEPVADSPNQPKVLDALQAASIVVWTTTPWTIPGNRAIAFNPNLKYVVFEATREPLDSRPLPLTIGSLTESEIEHAQSMPMSLENYAQERSKFLERRRQKSKLIPFVGRQKFVVARELVNSFLNQIDASDYQEIGEIGADELAAITCKHPFRGHGYDFSVHLFPADFVTSDAGTGFVHIAPSHGQDDYRLMVQNIELFCLGLKGFENPLMGPPRLVADDGRYFEHVPLFGGPSPRRVIDDEGNFGDANEAVIQELIKADALIGGFRHKHDYPHSWRSKKPVIFRNTPQWFIAMDTAITEKAICWSSDSGIASCDTLRNRALHAISDTRWVPPQGENRIGGMIETRPDWVVSRQRAWGVPITVFWHKDTGRVIPARDFNTSGQLIDRIVEAFRKEGADAWFEPGGKERFLEGLVDSPQEWEKVDDILDVWFDSGSTHAFVLEVRPDLKWPASLYLEGSDQHRGWFQSSLLESCGTRGRAPFDAVLTHGFVVDEDGRKMSKSLGNVVAPQDVIRQSGAEILRLWAMSSDYAEDLRIGPDIIKANVESYRKLRNTLRFLLGNLAHYQPELAVAYAEMPELERCMLWRLAELDGIVRAGYDAFDFKRVFHALLNFCVNDLSAFYFDIRKDALYCDPYRSVTRRAALTVLDTLFSALTAWLAPMLAFTMEEAWLNRFPSGTDSVHLRQFPKIPDSWRDEVLSEKWRKVRSVRRVITGALEIERKEGRIGSSLEAAPKVYIADSDLRDALAGVDLAEIAITSGASLTSGAGPEDAFRLDDVPGVAVVFTRAQGKKCARSWKILEEVGANPEFPELSPRDAEAVRQFDARQPLAAE
jgi:isoleucyl-tRNA synthetase